MTTSVGCRGGSRYVDGCWEFPYLKIRGFKVSWFLVFDFGFLGFVVLWVLLFYGFMVFGFWFSFFGFMCFYDVYGFAMFMVLWFDGFMFFVVYSCMVFRLYGFQVLYFDGFMLSKVYQIAISCFLIDGDPISKIFEIVLDGSSSFFGTRLFQICSLIPLEDFP